MKVSVVYYFSTLEAKLVVKKGIREEQNQYFRSSIQFIKRELKKKNNCSLLIESEIERSAKKQKRQIKETGLNLIKRLGAYLGA
jgi:hypothetical protein